MARKVSTTPGVSLDGFYQWFSRDRCLKLVARELGRLGIDEEELPPYQRELYRDLWSPLDEWALAEMLHYWTYDVESLLRRGQGYSRHVPAKPRIDVVVELTSKGNLKAEWFPTGWNRWGSDVAGQIGCDFQSWMRLDHRFQAYDSRPSNELFFIHSVDHAVGTIRHPRDWPSRTRVLDQVFLRACSAVVEELKERLEHHFNVHMITDIFVDWQEGEEDADPGSWHSPPPTMVGWAIADPAEKLAEAERAELAAMEQSYGFSAEEMLSAWREELEHRRPTGPAPSPHTLMDRITRRLKAKGFSATRGQTQRSIELLRKHRAEDCPPQ